MAFTGTHSANTNIIINTGTEGIYLFKEPNIDFTNKSLSVVIDNAKFKEDIFNHHFLNDELNNFFGVLKEETATDLLNLTGSKTVKQQLFPNPKYSGIKSLTRRVDFIFPWKDDPDLSSSAGHEFNIENKREANSSHYRDLWVNPSITGSLIGSGDNKLTGSIWPLDSYRHISNEFTGIGAHVSGLVLGELMVKMNTFQLGIPYRYNSLVAYTEARGNETLQPKTHLPWTAYRFANSKPYRNLDNFYKNYKNYSIIPEFNLSSLLTIDSSENIHNEIYSKSFNFFLTGTNYSHHFSQKDNFHLKKMIFEIKSVINLLPYNNFYPVQFSIKCAKNLSQSLARVDSLNNFFTPILPTYNIPKLNFIISTFFGPGVLFESIKCGQPTQKNYGGNTTDNYIIKFEDLFDPQPFIRDLNLAEVNSLNIPLLEVVYFKDAIKNFLEEIRYTFCKNSSLEYFQSKPEDQFGIFYSGTKYSMDIWEDIGNVTKDQNDLWIGGVNYFGLSPFNLSNILDPPIWYSTFTTGTIKRGLSLCRFEFTPPETREYRLNEIFSLMSTEFRYDKRYNYIEDGQLPAFKKLTSSFNIFEKEEISNGLFCWKINSKWELPYLCATSTVLTYSNGYFRTNDPAWMVNYQPGLTSTIGGLWHDFCEAPRENQGLFLNISDVNYETASSYIKSASLAEKVGFPKSGRRRVGELNDQKEIGELICILPIDAKTKSTFKISKDNSINKFNEKMMRKYILPGKLDHIHYPIDATLFFCEEITDIWSKKDLSYIWQNLLPENGMNHKEKNTKIVIEDREVLRILSNKDIYFMIFKCKLRSKNNENDNIGSNWPWDFCSIVELAKIDIITEEN